MGVGKGSKPRLHTAGVAVGRGWRTSSTLAAVLADVSKKTKPCSCANCCPSSDDTARRCSRSDLLPMSMMVMFELECCLASSSQEVRWLKVSRRVMS